METSLIVAYMKAKKEILGSKDFAQMASICAEFRDVVYRRRARIRVVRSQIEVLSAGDVRTIDSLHDLSSWVGVRVVALNGVQTKTKKGVT